MFRTRIEGDLWIWLQSVIDDSDNDNDNDVPTGSIQGLRE